MKITFVTGNQNKAKEVAAIMAGVDMEARPVDLPEIQSLDLRVIVEAKARAAYGAVGSPVMVEDVSFEIAALGGFPGPFVKFWNKTVGYERGVEIARLFGDCRATARCGVGFFDGDRRLYTEGVINGSLVPRGGESDFGFDPFFVPDGSDQTYAKMGVERKNATSHRFLAFTAMRKKLFDEGLLIRLGER